MISTENIALGFGDKHLFKDVSIAFTPGGKYGVIGANGAGKSTFLKILAGEQNADKGDVSIPPRARLGVLRQDHYKYDDFTVLDTTYQGYGALWKIMKERADLYAKVDDMSEEEGNRLGELEGEFMELDGYSAESEAAGLLTGLGVPEELHNSLMKEIPTNFKFRTLLAQVLFGKPDIMLLDEPTNNLDIRSIAWLENFLNEYEGTVITVSHDREFLNAICDHICDIDFGKIKLYTGDYDYYASAVSIARDHSLTEEARRKKRADELKNFIQRFGANKSKARQATSRKKELERLLEEETIQPSSRVYPHIVFPMERELGKDIVRLDSVKKGYDGETVHKNLNVYFEKGDKVAVIGPNGVGKTTFMRMLMQEIEPDSGEVVWGVTTKRTYCPQDVRSSLPKEQTIFGWLSELFPDFDREHIRSILGRMLFRGTEGDKKIDVLSGGEAVRATLCKMMLEEGNVVLLDEPTNHLDLESIEALSWGLQRFAGTVFFVSHDRRFIESVATRVLEFFPNGDYNDYRGTFKEYRETQKYQQ